MTMLGNRRLKQRPQPGLGISNADVWTYLAGQYYNSFHQMPQTNSML